MAKNKLVKYLNSHKLISICSLVVFIILVFGIYLFITTIRPKSDPPVLHLGFMIHLEGWFSEVNNEQAFNDHVAATRDLASTLEEYGAKGTFEASPEFIRGIANWDDNVLAELEESGHAVGVHADIGGNIDKEGLGLSGMIDQLQQMKFDFEKTVGIEARHVSGICSELDWVQAAIQAGYQFTTGGVAYCVMSMPEQDRPEQFRNCRNPGLCHDVFPLEVKDRIHPWQVSSGEDWLEHDPDGELVYLASDQTLYGYDGDNDQISKEDVDLFFESLDQHLDQVEVGKVNQMYVSWSLGSAEKASDQMIASWLGRLVPYIESGQVEWSTIPEVYDLYLQYEDGLVDSKSVAENSVDLDFVTGDTIEIAQDVVYAQVGDQYLALDLYRPIDIDQDLPLLVWIHGGGWSGGDKGDISEMCQYLTEAGYVVASVNYRLSGNDIWPAQIHDVKAAVRWLRANADSFAADPDKIGVIGSSAGGHLASMLGVTDGVDLLEGGVGDYGQVSSQVQAVVDMFGPVNLDTLDQDCAGDCVMDHNMPDSPESRLLGCSLSDCADQARLASVSNYISADDPPFLVIHGDEDVTIPMAQSTELTLDLSQNGVQAEFIRATGYAHSRAMFWKYSDEVINFFNKNLK